MDDSEQGTTRVVCVDPVDESVLAGALAELGVAVTTVDDCAGALSAVPGADAVVARQSLADGEGLDVLERVRARRPGLPVVLHGVDGDEHLASEAVRAGVTDYLPGDLPPADAAERVLAAVADAPSDRARAGEPRTPTVADGGAEARSSSAGEPRFPEISESVKERAMDEAPVGITLSDPDMEDNPLVYVNDAYVELTGYDRDEAVGNNCRFLQGEETGEEPVAEMAKAIAAEEPVSVEILNYRKDGSEFYNRVDVAPIYDDDGELIHYVGFQLDITDRVAAEQAATERADQLEHLLDRVNGLVSDITGSLVSAASRPDVERAAPGRLVESDPFELAWVGRRDLAAEAVVATEWAPGDAAFDGFTVPLSADDDPVTRAVETGAVQVGPVADTSHEEGPAGAAGVDTVAAVPLTYRDTCYGAMAVYADGEGAFDERERTVLGALGRAMATAINAQESQRMLSTDDVVELDVAVRDPSLFFVAMSRELDCEVEFVGAVYPEEEPPLWFLVVEGAEPGAVETFVADRETPAGVDLLAESERGAVFEFEVPEDPIVTLLADRGAELRELSAADGLAELLVELPREADARAVVEGLRERYDGVDLRAYRQRERPARTRGEFVAALEERLTDRQLTALQKAYAGGFFEWPHGTSGDELAESMDISRSTFHQHLRAAQRKLVEEFYER
jgi:PAS domain S-box-containing protein